MPPSSSHSGARDGSLSLWRRAHQLHSAAQSGALPAVGAAARAAHGAGSRLLDAGSRR